MSKSKEDPSVPMLHSEVLAEEFNRIRPDSPLLATKSELGSVLERLHDSRLTALCLSGGGIRSATFALGLVQALARRRLLSKFDFLSTVSGGGYLGSWLSAWIRIEHVNAFERAAVEILYKANGSDNTAEKKNYDEKEAIDKHFNQSGTEVNSFEFIRYQEFKYGLTSELKRKADISPEASVKCVADEKGIAEIIVVEGIQPQDVEAPLPTETIDKKVADLIRKYSKTKAVRDYGILNVQAKLTAGLSKNSSSPNPEHGSIRHLRQYSNYMTPAVGIASADSWAFIGIYLRNLFLNWTIFIPALMAFLLIPRLLYSVVVGSKAIFQNPWFVGGAVLISAALVIWCLRYIVESLPSKNIGNNLDKRATDASVSLHSVFTLVVAGFVLSLAWWRGGTFIGSFGNVSVVPKPILFIAASLVVYTVAYLLYYGIRKGRGHSISLNLSSIIAALISSVTGGLLIWFCCQILWPRLTAIEMEGIFVLLFSNASIVSFGLSIPSIALSPLFITLATPIFLLCFLVQTMVFVGISSKSSSDADREWLARYGGWLMITALGWVFINSLVFYGVDMVQALYNTVFPSELLNYDIGNWTRIGAALTPLFAVLTGLLAILGGFSSSSAAGTGQVKTGWARVIQIAIPVASIASLLAFLITLSYLTAVLLSKTYGWLHKTTVAEPITHWYHNLDRSPHLEVITKVEPLHLLVWILLLTGIACLMSVFLSVNDFSLHGAYRDRLVRAYLGASSSYRRPDPFTGFSEKDNRQLHRLKNQRPYHILCATMNLIQSSNLAWQKRKAASFTMSPLFCGSWPFGYRRTNEYSTQDNKEGCKYLRYCNKSGSPCTESEECMHTKSLRLGTAMAISGAAANPNMGHYSSPVVTFLMGIFNVRLGWWLGNPGKAGSGKDFWRKLKPKKARYFFQRASPAFAMMPLINEVLGRTSEDKRYVNVTDGGHFENLAIYEMVARRCRLIIVSDAAADANFKFGEISNAIEKCRVDLGVEIQFRSKLNIHAREATDEIKNKGQRYAIADIIYPEKNGHGQRRRGYLIYLRPTLSGREPIEILHYAKANSSFPHQSTGDQFFDETQFEAYRELGMLTLDEIFRADDVKEILSRFTEH